LLQQTDGVGAGLLLHVFDVCFGLLLYMFGVGAGLLLHVLGVCAGLLFHMTNMCNCSSSDLLRAACRCCGCCLSFCGLLLQIKCNGRVNPCHQHLGVT
jgi:hypothetical protein